MCGHGQHRKEIAMPSRLPARPSLEQLRKQAKDLLKAAHVGDEATVARFRAVVPGLTAPSSATLADAQFVLAREHGFENWAALVHHVESMSPSGLGQLEKLADDLARAYSSADVEAIRKINWAYGFSFVWHDEPEAMQRRLPRWFGSTTREIELAVADARLLVARTGGFESWDDLARSVATSASEGPASVAAAASRFYRIDTEQNAIEVFGLLGDRHLDAVAAMIREQGLTGLKAGALTDNVLDRLSRCDLLTHVSLGYSGQVTDRGFRYLARLPRLQELDLGGPGCAITDRGLETLRHLRELRRFSIQWAPRITDAGIAHLEGCERLESVDLMGTPAGDGAITALGGKKYLRKLATGTLVTDAGIRLLHRLPRFKTWNGGEVMYGLMSFDSEPTHLLLDGPFTDAGLAQLSGLDGLFGLNLFWHAAGFTAAGLRSLTRLANLGMLGCSGQRCDDEAMRAIGEMPALRMLQAQGTIASDAGFNALSRSRSLEFFWAREAPNLTGAGFAALSTMPSLRGLAVSCRNVDETSLAVLPDFPALRDLMPMDVQDAGFQHVGRCGRLEQLWMMYCRDTTDEATAHIAGLSELKTYYAGETKITDDSLQILGRMRALERLEFWSVAGITDAGVVRLATLPRLRELVIEGSPGVTRAVVDRFPPGVRVKYRS
jgi:hypothetical protein